MCCFRWCGRQLCSSASTTCRFRESIPHPVQPLSTLRTPRYRDARKTRSRPACSALDGPDFHWQAHSSFPIAPRTRLLPLIGFLRVNYRLEKEGPFERSLSGPSHAIASQKCDVQRRATDGRSLPVSPEPPRCFPLSLVKTGNSNPKDFGIRACYP